MDSGRIPCTPPHAPALRPFAAAIRSALALLLSCTFAVTAAEGAAGAPPVVAHGGEASLILPSLDNSTKVGVVSVTTADGRRLQVKKSVPWSAEGAQPGDAGYLAPVLFLGLTGKQLLMSGLAVCVLGFIFGLMAFRRVRDLPVHRSMREISELIYATCKTYLITQTRFLGVLWLLIAAIIIAYFGFLTGDGAGGHGLGAYKVFMILACSVVGILGSVGVAWFGIRINTFANSRTAFAALKGKGYPCYAIPLLSGMSIGTLLISVELIIMLGILLFLPPDLAGPCFIGFAIGESLGAAVLRIAGGIFTKIADIGSDLMKIVFKVKEDDARNPGVIADCTGDNAGDSGRAHRRRLRDLRRHRRGAGLVHHAGGARSDDPGAAAGVDLRHARGDGATSVGLLLPQRVRHRRSRVIANAVKVQLRAPADLAGGGSPRWCRSSLTFVAVVAADPHLGGRRRRCGGSCR